MIASKPRPRAFRRSAFGMTMSTAFVLLFYLASVIPASAAQMYMASPANNKIVRANLDGTGAVDLGDLNGSLTFPWGIALDSSHLMFLPLLLR